MVTHSDISEGEWKSTRNPFSPSRITSLTGAVFEATKRHPADIASSSVFSFEKRGYETRRIWFASCGQSSHHAGDYQPRLIVTFGRLACEDITTFAAKIHFNYLLNRLFTESFEVFPPQSAVNSIYRVEVFSKGPFIKTMRMSILLPT